MILLKQLLFIFAFVSSTAFAQHHPNKPGHPGHPGNPGNPFPPPIEEPIKPINPGNPNHPGHPGHFGNTVGAQERFVINFNGVQLQGQNVIKIKQELKKAYPNLDLKDYVIVTASLLGQTKQGKGNATLIVGNEASDSKTVSGTPNKWNSGKPQDYVRVHFDSPKSPEDQINEKSVWQMELDGNFIVQNVEVHIAPVKIKTGPKDIFGDFIGIIIDKIK